MYQHIPSGLLAAWLSLAPLWAQQCPDKPISTDPDSPVSESGSIAVPNPFDWRVEYFDVNSQYQPPSAKVIHSPFYHRNNGDLAHLVDSKDMQPEDGWELITYKTGVNPDGTPQPTQAGFVYMVLYNRYTGIMRVMAAGDPEKNHHGARIRVQFNDGGQYTPSVYSHISEVQAVETLPLASRSAMSVMRYRGGNSQWFYADFPMAYDPCVCEYESSMNLEISLIGTAGISLSGDISGTLANGQVKENGYSFQNLEQGAKKAQKSYSTVDAWTSAQLRALQMEGKTQAQLNEAEKQKKAELKALQAVLKSRTFLQKGLGAAPYLAGALDLVEFFVAGGRTSPGPQAVQLTPMAMNAGITLQGEMSTSSFDDVIFYTPGSKNANHRSVAEWYPFYNEVMGTFNLMEEPRVFYNLSTTSIPSTPALTLYEYKLKLDESSLKPLLNPAADLEAQGIRAAISVSHRDIVNSDLIFATDGLSVQPKYRSRMVPLGCLSGLTLNITSTEQLSDVGLILYVNLKREDAGPNTQNVLMLLEFPVQLINETSDPSFDWSSPYSGYQANPILNSSTRLITDDVVAWETITIEDGATFQPGPNGIKIIAGEEIIVEPDANLPPGVELIIGDPTQCTQTTPLQTAAEIRSFCQSNTYQHPGRLLRLRKDSMGLSASKLLSLTAHPNPTSHRFTLGYTLPEAASVSLTLYDLTGRPVMPIQAETLTQAGPQELTVDVSPLAAGMYQVVLQADGQRQSVKVVKTE